MKIKKYNEGGELDPKFTELGGAMDIAQGAVKSIYGIKQLRDANQALSAAQASQPSLQTPTQFYENYRNAYDSELARIESDAIQGNVATSIQALQGAGGRALVGGLGAATAQAQNAQNKMLAQERQMRAVAGRELAMAQDKSVARREARSQQQISQAQAAANAARQNIVGGVTDVATGLMAGGAKPIIAGAKKAAGAVGKAGKYVAGVPSKIQDWQVSREIAKTKEALGDYGVNENMMGFINNQMQTQRDAAKSWQDYYGSQRMDNIVAGLKKPMVEIQEENIDRAAMGEAQFHQEQRNKAVAVSDQTSQYSGVGGSSMFGGKGAYLGIPATIAETASAPFTSGMNGTGTSNQMINYNLNEIQNAQGVGDNMIYDAFSGQYRLKTEAEVNASKGSGYAFGIKPVDEFQHGGMMTDGSFNHNKNPIDIVQNGVKVGEATGGEFILNPEQAAKIRKESSYARKLFKQFEKKAKTKK